MIEDLCSFLVASSFPAREINNGEMKKIRRKIKKIKVYNINENLFKWINKL